jgi:hypothetical protein
LPSLPSVRAAFRSLAIRERFKRVRVGRKYIYHLNEMDECWEAEAKKTSAMDVDKRRWSDYKLSHNCLLFRSCDTSAIAAWRGPQGTKSFGTERGSQDPPRLLDLSLLDIQRDPADLFIEVDHVLDVERHPFCLAPRRSNLAIYVQDRVESSR